MVINLSLPAMVVVMLGLDYEFVDDVKQMPYLFYLHEEALPDNLFIEMSKEPQEPISREQYLLPSKDANTTRIDEYG